MIAESGDCGSNRGMSGEEEWPIAKPEAGLQVSGPGGPGSCTVNLEHTCPYFLG